MSNDYNIAYIQEKTEKLDAHTDHLIELKQRIQVVYEFSLKKSQDSLMRFTDSLDFYINWLVKIKENTISQINAAITENSLRINNLFQEIGLILDKVSRAKAELGILIQENYEEINQILPIYIPIIEEDSNFQVFYYMENTEWTKHLCPLVNVENKSLGIVNENNKNHEFK